MRWDGVKFDRRDFKNAFYERQEALNKNGYSSGKSHTKNSEREKERSREKEGLSEYNVWEWENERVSIMGDAFYEMEARFYLRPLSYEK